MTTNLIQMKIGQSTYQGGCFTFEGYIKGQNIMEIARRLGLPQWRMDEGFFVAHALTLPGLHEFELAGVTIDSTDKFMTYDKKGGQYHADKFAKLYTGINIPQMKKAYMDVFPQNKLVKVIPAKPHEELRGYPAGTMVPQFIMTRKLQCLVTAFVPAMGTFR